MATTLVPYTGVMPNSGTLSPAEEIEACREYRTWHQDTYIPWLLVNYPTMVQAATMADMTLYKGEWGALGTPTTLEMGWSVSIGDIFYVSKINGNTNTPPSVNHTTHTTVENVLNSTLTSTALSANMGRVLDETKQQKKTVQQITSSGYNGISILIDGRLYTSHGTTASYENYTSGRKNALGTDNIYGVDGGLKEVMFPNETAGTIVKAGGHYISTWVLFANGNLYTWGYNILGQIGLGHNTHTYLPTLSATGVTDVYDHPSNGGYAIGYNRLFIKKTDNYIYFSGYNGYGAGGDGTTINRNAWTQVTSLGTTVKKVYNLGTDYGMTVFQKDDNTIWACGKNQDGCFGVGAGSASYSTPIDITSNWFGGANFEIKNVVYSQSYYTTSRGNNATLGILLDDGVTTKFSMCGNNYYSQCGDGTIIDRNTPYLFSASANRIKQVVGNGAILTIHLITESNELFGWGRGPEGQIGNGSSTNQSTPQQIVSPTASWDELLSDGNNSNSYGYQVCVFARATDDKLYGTGWYYLGTGDYANHNSFTEVKIDKKVTLIGNFTTATSGLVSIASTEDNELFAWGYNVNRGITDGASTDNVYTPIQIQGGN